MRIVDPIPFLGVDSGLRVLRVTPAEARTLTAAAALLDRAHTLVVDQLGDDHYYDDEITDALCTAPDGLRRLATEGLSL